MDPNDLNEASPYLLMVDYGYEGWNIVDAFATAKEVIYAASHKYLGGRWLIVKLVRLKEDENDQP